MKKNCILTLLLGALLLQLMGLIGCAGDTPETETTASTEAVSETAGETVLSDDLPERDFAGAEFRILSYDPAHCNGIHVVKESTGEGVNDAIFKITNAIEERFNVVMTEILDWEMCTSGIQKTILAGDDAVELNLPSTNSSFSFLQKDCVLNYNMLPYVDLDKPYWVSSMNKDVSIGGQYYYAFGGLDLSHLDYTHMMVFSKDMVTNYSLENFYDLVREGKWTLDKMKEAMSVVSYDPDVKRDEPTDIYGYVATPKQILPNFWEAAGVKSIDKNEDDSLYYAIPGNENFATIVDHVFSLLWDTGYWKQTKDGNNTDPQMPTLLEEGRMLFGDTTFHYVKTLRDIDADFGLLPYPKWDDTQRDYMSRAEGGIRCPMVPITVSDPEYVSIIMEALSFAGYTELLPAYFDEGLKGKVSRDEESAEMLDIIYETRVYDLGDCVWINDIRDGFIHQMFANNDRELVSNVEKNRNKIETELAEAMEIANQ